MIQFVVEGQPVQKGSTHSFLHRQTGKIITLQTNADKLKPWTEKVRYAARAAKVEMKYGAVLIVANCYMRPPKSYKGGAMIKRPDTDKLIRAVLDSLTGIAYQDDSQVTAILCRKKYAEAQGKERTEIEIRP